MSDLKFNNENLGFDVEEHATKSTTETSDNNKRVNIQPEHENIDFESILEATGGFGRQQIVSV